MLKVGFNPSMSASAQSNNKYNAQKISFTAWEKTLLGLKSDAFEKGLAQTIEKEVIKKTGLKKVNQWEGIPTKAKMEKHYAAHKGRSFFDGLIQYVTRGKFKAITLEGEDAVSKLRNAATEIRAKYAPGATRENLIHSSDSVESANEEIINFFG